jgi:hypothetical protein
MMDMANEGIPVNNGNAYISGRGIRRRKLDRDQRVRLAADLVTREAQLDLSISQSAALLSVAPAEVSKELRARAAARDAKQAASILVNAWTAASDIEREDAVRMIGVADVWDVLARVIA